MSDYNHPKAVSDNSGCGSDSVLPNCKSDEDQNRVNRYSVCDLQSIEQKQTDGFSQKIKINRACDTWMPQIHEIFNSSRNITFVDTSETSIDFTLPWCTISPPI
jgi:hypothetical protein